MVGRGWGLLASPEHQTVGGVQPKTTVERMAAPASAPPVLLIPRT